ncbi:cob(I)yrinic acid a,c-diamide adenosyltransferase [Dysgonomonas sp. ZJ709]|uniref:cob(I)yrinic acid a,c-diamide adenosyltransferase n=1 Tax=Dysgonomonas sp. ZJ709 TaxID=2709797 RepID=UPI0013EAC3C1|nr:cob(I)yrinic acid a,c-diamide adenosyltransferase [Dysgonomonas sp. ZJ709]
MKKSLVYTKTGDKGKTSLVGGKRVAKAHIRLEAYGTIDELNSFTGSLICQIEDEEDLKILSYIQHKLFTVGSYLATETEAISPKAASIIIDKDIALLENEMDRMDSELPPLRQFVLPGGSEAAAQAHICRTVCRRAERCIYRVKEEFPVDDNIMTFVNRLSDYFFLLSRKECNKNGKEIFWNQEIIQ